MGHEHVGDFEDISGGEIPQVSEIEEDGTPFIGKSDDHSWISPWGIDQSRVHGGFHDTLPSIRISLTSCFPTFELS
jgi:hypothetical protein